VVGEGHAPAAKPRCRHGDLLRCGSIGQRVDLTGFRYVPVLTESTRQITAGRSERQHGRPGQEVVQWFLLDRINTESGRPPLRREHDFAARTHTHEAQAGLPLMQRAGPRADVTADPPIVETGPPDGRMSRFGYCHTVSPCPMMRRDRRGDSATLVPD